MSEPPGTVSTSPHGVARSPAQIERDIEATRDRLAGTIDEISDRVKPANLVADAKAKVKAQFINADGSPRTDRIAVVGGAALAVVAVVALRARRH
ncbi:DUF3618 domain-containing protein [Motilibacter aurantiacus]|uniref:DUF3618 domain-containing protein n=1 Tax=Motilibacter aurantiacus TaxID=2714955 RepID=UPI002F2B6AE8